MKGEKQLYLLVVVMLVLSITATNNNVNAYATPVVYATVHKFYTYADLTSTRFNVTIGIRNVTDMGAWEFRLDYNTTLLDAEYVYSTPDTANNTDWVPVDLETGTFQPDGPPTINNTIGRVRVGALCPQPPGGGITGDFELVKVQFHIIVAPPYGFAPPENRTYSCALDLHSVVIGDSYANPITVNEEDGLYSYTRRQWSVWLMADFTWNPQYPYVGDDVTLTDTSWSSGGTLIAWLWTLTGPATLGPNNTQNTNFTCDGVGDVQVTLTVWNNLGDDGTISYNITQVGPCRIFDLYTSSNRWCGQVTPFIGRGPNNPADSLSPDVNITLFAEVSWNGAPRNHVLVAFEVLDNLNRCITYRTAESNKDGLAWIWFRIPTPCDEQLFGKWFVYVSAKIQDTKFNDTMRFDVGYPITLLDVTIDKDTYYAPSDYLIATVFFANIMFIEKELTLVAVAYDDCDVPIGQVIVDLWVPGGVYCHPYYMNITLPSIHIPQWTYVGVGKLYVSAFTRLPKDCGVAYSPELGPLNFKLEWAL